MLALPSAGVRVGTRRPIIVIHIGNYDSRVQRTYGKHLKDVIGGAGRELSRQIGNMSSGFDVPVHLHRFDPKDDRTLIMLRWSMDVQSSNVHRYA